MSLLEATKPTGLQFQSLLPQFLFHVQFHFHLRVLRSPFKLHSLASFAAASNLFLVFHPSYHRPRVHRESLACLVQIFAIVVIVLHYLKLLLPTVALSGLLRRRFHAGQLLPFRTLTPQYTQALTFVRYICLLGACT